MKHFPLLAIAIIVLGAGGGDFAGGLFLMCSPDRALSLLELPAVRDSVFLAYIGVFVAAIGSYYLAGFAVFLMRGSTSVLRAAWGYTAFVRLLIGGFVAVQIMRGSLAPRWGLVSFVDWSWALAQILSFKLLGRI